MEHGYEESKLFLFYIQLNQMLPESLKSPNSKSKRTLVSSAMAHQTSIDSLPRDLCCAEILTRLDPESLYTCKLVSKSWYDLITNRSFTQLYSEKRPKITFLFFQSNDMYPEKLQYVAIYPNQEYISDPPSCLGFLDSHAILQSSCNGLLLWLWVINSFLYQTL